jgi:hypothetical protein
MFVADEEVSVSAPDDSGRRCGFVSLQCFPVPPVPATFADADVGRARGAHATADAPPARVGGAGAQRAQRAASREGGPEKSGGRGGRGAAPGGGGGVDDDPFVVGVVGFGSGGTSRDPPRRYLVVTAELARADGGPFLWRLVGRGPPREPPHGRRSDGRGQLNDGSGFPRRAAGTLTHETLKTGYRVIALLNAFQSSLLDQRSSLSSFKIKRSTARLVVPLKIVYDHPKTYN